MTQQEIATATGCSQSHVHYMFKGDRTVSVKNSLKLEEATGVCREAWVFPERHWNPYIPFSSYANCGNCKNKIHRIRKVIPMMIKHLKDADDKRIAIQEILEIPKVIHGYQDSEFISFREITDKGLKLLGYIGAKRSKLPDLITYKRSAFLINAVKENHYFYWAFSDLQNHRDEEKHLYAHAKKAGLKSIHMVSSKRHIVLSAVNSEREQRFSDQVVKGSVKLINSIDQIWHDAFYA